MEIVKSNRSLGAEIRNINLEKDLTKEELDFRKNCKKNCLLRKISN